jgi:hypothetical protein
LATVQEFAQKSGGALTLASRSNVGTSFSLYLPIEIEEANKDQPSMLSTQLAYEEAYVIGSTPTIETKISQNLESIGVHCSDEQIKNGLLIVDDAIDGTVLERIKQAREEGAVVIVATSFDPDSSVNKHWRGITDALIATPFSENTFRSAWQVAERHESIDAITASMV